MNDRGVNSVRERLSRELIEEIRRRNDIVDIISGYVSLKKSGKTYKALCPFHSERDASFNVNREKQLFKCFGCGEGGNVITFVMKADNLPFTEALEKLARRAGITIERTPEARQRETERKRLLNINELACRYYQRLLVMDDCGKAAREYLEGRELGPEMIKEYRLGYAAPEWRGLAALIEDRGLSAQDGIKAGLLLPRNGGGVYDRFRGRVIFPIFNLDGDIVGFGGRAMGEEQPKYLNTTETPVFTKGRLLYGLYQGRSEISRLDEAVVVEGYTDVLSCHRVGIRNVTASLGTALTAEQVRLITRYTHNIKLCYDADSAGMTAALRGLDLFEAEGCNVTVVDLGNGVDPDDFVRSGGAEAFREKMASARSVIDYKMSMALSRHSGDRTAVLREMLPALAGIGDAPRRSTAISALATVLAGKQAGQAQILTMEQMIHQELGESMRRRGVRRAGNEYIARTVTAGTDENRYLMAEKGLLRAILGTPDSSGVYPEEIGLEHFEDDACRWVFAKLTGAGGISGECDLHQLSLEGGPEVEALLTDIQMREDSITEQAIRDYADRLMERTAKKRLQELEAEINEGLERGTISASDECYKEYRRLISYLHGR
ncbi:MAG: DNA primase [bacterium]|nr:DNA primase [bacterium]